MLLTEYKDWAEKEVLHRPEAQLTRDWAKQWNRSHRPLIKTGVYEHAGLIFAKLEFLGSLLQGNVLESGGVAHAVAYADAFLPPQYKGLTVQNVKLFEMVRHKTLHGFTPAAVPVVGTSDVIGWRFNDPSAAHLTVSVTGRLGINSEQLHVDFIGSVKYFSKYLATNVDPKYPDLPTVRWRRGFWLRFCPVKADQKAWLQLGKQRGLY